MHRLVKGYNIAGVTSFGISMGVALRRPECRSVTRRFLLRLLSIWTRLRFAKVCSPPIKSPKRHRSSRGAHCVPIQSREHAKPKSIFAEHGCLSSH